MVLKKQTVWLLTMLSLIVVLSVYYVTTPTQTPTAANKVKLGQQASTAKNSQGVNSNITAADNVFATYKLQRDKQVSAQAKQFEQIIASDQSSADQVSQATSELKALDDQANQEKLLEAEIVSKGFGSDACVTKDGSYAEVYVNTKSLSSKQASQIMSLVVKSSLGVQFADVKYQATNS